MANTISDDIYNILHSKEKNKEEKLKNIVIAIDNDMRVSVHQYYDAIYNPKLDDDFKKYTESHFRDIIRDLFLYPFDYNAKHIDKHLNYLKLYMKF